MNDQPLARANNLHKQFGAVCAVRGLDFQIRRGDVLGFLGCNGAGKSTTMAMLAGVLAPDRGTVTIAGHDLLLNPLEAKARLGYLPEIPPLYPEMLVSEYLHYCAQLRRMPKQRIHQAVSSALERCGLTEVSRRVMGKLSKGYRQRAGIAQAIIHNPQLVILDEPTSGLDPAQTVALRELVIALGEDHGVILSTHNLAEAQATCNRMLIIHDGSLRLDSALPDNGHTGAGPATIYRLVFQKTPDAEILAKLDPQATLIEIRDTVVRISLAGEPSSAAPVLERVLRQIAGHAWGLSELSPEGDCLESLFMRLTCGQEQDSPP